MFAVVTNRGAQVGLFNSKPEAQQEADDFNSQGLDVFAWVVEVPRQTVHEDMPGRGVIYG